MAEVQEKSVDGLQRALDPLRRRLAEGPELAVGVDLGCRWSRQKSLRAPDPLREEVRHRFLRARSRGGAPHGDAVRPIGRSRTRFPAHQVCRSCGLGP